MILSDGDLRLRAIEPSDAELLYTLINDPEIESKVVGWSGPVSLASQTDWISRVRPDEQRYVVEVEGSPCGVAIANPIDFKNRSANLNIKLLPGHQDKGLGGRTIHLLTKYLFLELGMEIVTAGVLETNMRSQKLFESAGFTREAVLRSRVFKSGRRQGIVQLSILRSEYSK